jgi:hypothetical protein
LDEAGADAKAVAEGTAVADITPARGARLGGARLHPLEEVCEGILCSCAMVLSAATLPALPGSCASMSASPAALFAVDGVGAFVVALAASWAWATAAAAAAAAL